jgi:hypothetical protein
MKKRAYKPLLFEPNRPQFKLDSFNDRSRITQDKLVRARLAQTRTEPELNNEPKLFYAALQ